MNIIHYFLGFPPLHNGGLMIYARDLAKEQAKMGHNVKMLMPGELRSSNCKSKIKFFAYEEGLPVYKIVNPQPVSFSGVYDPDEFIKPRNDNNYREFFSKHAVDVLHVYSLIGFPKELLDAAKMLGIKTVFTTHDYYGLCPKIQFYSYNHSQCEDYKSGQECVICNRNATKKALYRRHLYLCKFYKPLRNTYQSVKKILPNRKKSTLKLGC
ncbi:MAG TPA: glycosyltransferase [Fervidobacterium sp.]|nr:glycosyltransferase [Fervidobacterium sp.]